MDNKYANKQTINTYKQKFYNAYHNRIAPLFKFLEKERKKRLNHLSLIIQIIAAIFVLVLWDTCNLKASASMLHVITDIILLLGMIIALILIPIRFNNNFIKYLKYSCMYTLLEEIGDIKWFNKLNIIPDIELIYSNLFAIYNSRESYDGFVGNFKDVPFEISETDMKYITDSGKHRTVVNIFKGVIVKFKFNKTINATTIIATKGDKIILGKKNFSFLTFTISIIYLLCSQSTFLHGNMLFSLICFAIITVIFLIGYFLYVKFIKVNPKGTFNEIKLEDIEFSKKYRAYSTDQIESRYLITPAFMERFKNIETSFGTHNVKCSFYNNNLMFAISTNKNLFEIGNLFYSLNNPKQLEIFFNEITSIFMLIDYFKLDEKSGI